MPGAQDRLWRRTPLLLLALAAHPLPAASLGLEVVASRSQVEDCEGGEVEISILLRNPERLEVAGLQAFLRFPAELFEPFAYRKGELRGLALVNGPEPFGRGFPACDSPTPDPWDDARGLDVVAVSATAFGDEGSDAPVDSAQATLGSFAFRLRPGVTGGSGPARFSLEFESCSGVLQQGNALYDPLGASLEVAFLGTGATVEVSPSLRVSDLSCASQGADVLLGWRPPAISFDGLNVYRNGLLIRSLVLPSVRSVADSGAPGGSLRYEVAVISQGREETCRASCLVEHQGGSPAFVRGDANLDGRINISDPIALLAHLFSGQPIECRDAADVDDGGGLDITDAVNLLGHLFQGGPAPLPPFPQPGSDPTADSLDCLGPPA